MKIRFWRRVKFMLVFWKFIPFLVEFFAAREVSWGKKLLGVVMMVAYFLFPFDLIPDFIAGVGMIDDVVVIGFILQQFVKIAPESLKVKYGLWGDDGRG